MKIMLNLLKIIIFLPFIISCTTNRPSSPQNFFKLLGTKKGFSADQTQILKDIKISNLRIRQTKITDHERCIDGFRYIIELEGRINSDATYILEKVINNTPKCINIENNKVVPILIYLNSDGGSLNDGIAIGRMFRKNFEVVAVIVEDGQVCASACAIAYLGSVHRLMDERGILLFHAPYENKFGSIICADKIEINYLKEYIVEMLSFRGGKPTGERIFERMMSVCSSTNGWTLNRDAAQIYKIIL